MTEYKRCPNSLISSVGATQQEKVKYIVQLYDAGTISQVTIAENDIISQRTGGYNGEKHITT